VVTFSEVTCVCVCVCVCAGSVDAHPGTCQRYHGNVCSAVLATQRVYIPADTDTEQHLTGTVLAYSSLSVSLSVCLCLPFSLECCVIFIVTLRHGLRI